MGALGAKRTSFEKLQRDRAKKAKAAAKREKRLDRTGSPTGEDDGPGDAGPVGTPGSVDGSTDLPTEEVLELVARLHADFDNGDIGFEEFEERKTELLNRLSVD